MSSYRIVMVNGSIPVRSSGKPARCRGCDAVITWGTTEAGKYMPFDSDTNHTAHWKTCPKAGDFRKKEDAGR